MPGRSDPQSGQGPGMEGEVVRSRVAFHLDDDGDSVGDGCVDIAGPVTVTRERKYRPDFDDGLLYNGEAVDADGRGGIGHSWVSSSTDFV